MITRSAPSFVTSEEGSIGLQIGAQAVDAILLIMNKKRCRVTAEGEMQIRY